MPDVVGGSVTEVLAGLLLVSGLTTEVVKFAQGMQVRTHELLSSYIHTNTVHYDILPAHEGVSSMPHA